MVDPKFDNTKSDRYTSVYNHPNEGMDNPYTYDGNGNLICDNKYIYEYDYLNRLCAIYGLVAQGETLNTQGWREDGLALSRKISETLSKRKRRRLLVPDIKTYRDLLYKAQSKYMQRIICLPIKE